MTYETFLSKYHLTLNDQQSAAVQAVDGHVLLLAVPGSGKTTTLVSRLGYMVYALGIPPESILTTTYTVAATHDMRNRFTALFGPEYAQRLEFRTINGISARIIRSFENRTGRRAFDLVTDERQLSLLVTEIASAVSRDHPTESDIKALRTAITYAKNQMLTEDEIRAMDREIDHFSTVYREYQRILKERGWMDYDDQMVYARTILHRYPELLNALRARYRYLCVDEAQDTSRIQHDIIDLLAGGSGNLFMVGDEDQSIYGFRAAYPQALLEFDRKYPDARVLLMERNYRSTVPIVQAANDTILKNENRRPKRMISTRGVGTAVRSIECRQRKSQYAYLLKLARTCDQETAVLYRDNDCALPVIDLLEREGLPYRCHQMESGFFTHRVVRDITDIIRFSLDPCSGELLLRLYYKFGVGISKASAERAARDQSHTPLLELLSEDDTLSDWTRRKCRALLTHTENLLSERGDQAVYRILNFMGYGDFLQLRGIDLNRAHILESLGAQEPSPLRLLERLSELQKIIENRSPSPDARLILSTIHSSKGLEYPRVILMDVFDGILPKQGDDVDIEEERRLFYVGMTRARDELSIFTSGHPGLTSVFSAPLFPEKAAPSRPITPAPKKTVDRGATLSRRVAADDYEEFVPDAIVLHRSFGMGLITRRSGDLIAIRFEDGGERRLSLSATQQAGVLKLISDSQFD